jgi:micrococcal nuclease
MIAVILLLLLIINAQAYAQDNLTSLAEIVRVVDGDTVIVRGLEGFNKGQEFRVRLADINAPELSTQEGIIAKEYLSSILGKNRMVLLDIDDKYIYDRYGRVVAVMYIIKDGSSTLININWLLVNEGYAVYRDYDNEFNPNDWVKEIECHSIDQADADMLRCIPELPMPIIALSTALLLGMIFGFVKRIHLHLGTH